ncbi:hypothetical protein LINPERHAP2_LOCUS3961 [Linum perenne]
MSSLAMKLLEKQLSRRGRMDC